MRRLTEEERAARQAARESKRLENQQRWGIDPTNANVRRAAERAAIKAIPAELSPEFKGSNALRRLRLIMANPDVSLSRRLRAAQQIIRFELAPGGAIGLEPHEIASDAYQFFSRVAESAEASDTHRQESLEAMAAVEAERAIRSDPGAAVAQRNTAIALINSARRGEMVACGAWARICASGARWYIETSDDIEVPSTSPQSGSIGQMLDAALYRPAEQQRRHRERREALLKIEARNRPDRWRDLMTP